MRPWTRDDAILTMAVHLDRPRRLAMPPMPERERLASILRSDVDEVAEHLWHFRDLEAGAGIDCACSTVWRRFARDPPGLWEAADAVMARRRGVPFHLRRRRGARSG